MEFGQAYCKDLLKIIPMKFNLHFSELHSIYYQFLNLKKSQNFKSANKIEKKSCRNSFGPALGPRPHGLSLAQWPIRHGRPTTSGRGARAHWCGQCGHTPRGGMATADASTAGPGFSLHCELPRDIDGLPGKERRMGSH
jgi:hypothetical protein